MEGSIRDQAEDWVLSGDARPPLLGELVERIDEAMAVARASEAAVASVGAAAIEAANQARRAAVLAERASAAILDSQRRFGGEAATDQEGSLRRFTLRADRVQQRLQTLQRIPARWRPASVSS